jgi:hypothetical protein
MTSDIEDMDMREHIENSTDPEDAEEMMERHTSNRD